MLVFARVTLSSWVCLLLSASACAGAGSEVAPPPASPGVALSGPRPRPEPGPSRAEAFSGPRPRPEPGPSRAEAFSGPRPRPEPGPSRAEAFHDDLPDGALALESRPSAAAPLLPDGARYRLVATAKEIALVVVGPDDRISGRLRIRPLERADAGYGSTILIDDFGGPDATIDAWSSAGGLHGAATVGDRRAAWQVRVDPDGSLAGESWSARHGAGSLELTELRRARAIGADIVVLAAELVDSGTLAPAAERELTELVVLAELALELSVRAWDGRGRASLPRVSNIADVD